MIDFRLLPPAEEEMTESALLYESASSGLGENFLADVQRAIDDAREHPEMGLSMGGGLRRMVLRRFPFSLIYAVEAGAVLVIAVAHQRRRPGYWHERL